MRILAGLEFGRATLTAVDDLGLGRGVIGEVVWGPNQLLRDLELRLGVGIDEEPEALRVAKWAERMAQLAPHGRFYTRSFDVDPLGTARTVLALRDRLIAAAWDGQPIPDGGPRLDAIGELEALNAPALPLGFADRVVAVRRALAACRIRPYAELTLAEPVELWETGWQSVFQALERAGTRLSREVIALPGAQPHTDLGQVQAALELSDSPAPIALRGDGSFVLMTAETSWEAARATAAILAQLPAAQSVVIRDDDVSALDNALSVQGLCTQGWRSTSPWRAALQVLPLALELAFEPKDPYRVLELLTLPVGPFQGLSGHLLARALAEAPGIGSPRWQDAKAQLAKRADASDVLGRIGEWLEQRGAESLAGAPKADILGVIARVRAWIVSRVPSAPNDATLLAAARQAGALGRALESDPRTTFSLVEVRRLAETIIASGITVQLVEERAGRIDHVASACVRVPREVVLWWAFAESENTHRALPWRRQELLALAAAGIHFPDPRARLAERANGWRRTIRAATRRVILVTPRTCAGATLSQHPLWDEIFARTGADEAVLRRITVSASDLLAQPSTQSLLDVPQLEALEAAPLPGGHPEWVVPREHVLPIERRSAKSLSALLSCPLKWALHYRAGIRSGGQALPALVKLNGTLGGRLVELLHTQGAFDLGDAALENCAESQLDELFRSEGAVLLRTGMGFERSQLRRQLVSSMLALARSLRAARLRIVGVEKLIDVPWRGAKLEGRIDLVVATDSGDHAIIDIKWGFSSYRDLLQSGQALQLAAYAFAHATERGDRKMPDAAYFSLKQSRLLGLTSRFWSEAESFDGPALDETWRKVECSLTEAERVVSQGRFPVTGVRRALPLLTAFGVNENEQSRYFAMEKKKACEYCDFDALCGRRWEASA